MHQDMHRKGATTGGFATSLAVHGALFLFLMFVMRMGAEHVDEIMEELTEIAYIEERYGEDVAKQVRMKTKPIVKAEEIKPETKVEEVKLEEVKPEEPKLAETQPVVKAPEPTLQSKPKLRSLAPPKLETRPTLKNKPMDIAAPRLTQAQQKQFQNVTSRKLDSKAFADASMPSLNTDNLRNVDALASDVSAPNLQSKQPAQAFQGDNVALVGRKSKTNLSDVEFDVSSSKPSGGRMAMKIATGGVEGGNAGLVGGRLEEGQTAWQGDVSELVQTAKANKARRASIDVPEPALQSRSTKQDRRTSMDYGAGNSGNRGSLKGGRRPAIAEAPAAATIAQAAPKIEEKAQIAETTPKAMGGKGVAMTISGQIKDRKIVQSTMPVYSDDARTNGWEGIVAVHFTVMPDGRVKDNVYFDQTSPHRDLNRAAMAAIKKFKFEALTGANRVEQWGVITIVFRLS